MRPDDAHNDSVTELAPAVPASFRAPRALAAFWIVAAVVGGVVAFLIYLEYIGQLTDSDPLITCSVSAVVTCGPNLLSPGGNLLGFSNSIAGMVLFTGPLYAAAASLAAPGGLRPWFWRVYAAFLAGAVVLVHVFAWRSVFEYGSLCPWCMVIWLVTIPVFWYTVAWMLRDGVFGIGPRRIGAVLWAWAPLVTVLDYTLIAVTAQVRLDVLGSLI